MKILQFFCQKVAFFAKNGEISKVCKIYRTQSVLVQIEQNWCITYTVLNKKISCGDFYICLFEVFRGAKSKKAIICKKADNFVTFETHKIGIRAQIKNPRGKSLE